MRPPPTPPTLLELPMLNYLGYTNVVQYWNLLNLYKSNKTNSYRNLDKYLNVEFYCNCCSIAGRKLVYSAPFHDSISYQTSTYFMFLIAFSITFVLLFTTFLFFFLVSSFTYCLQVHCNCYPQSNSVTHL